MMLFHLGAYHPLVVEQGTRLVTIWKNSLVCEIAQTREFFQAIGLEVYVVAENMFKGIMF